MGLPSVETANTKMDVSVCAFVLPEDVVKKRTNTLTHLSLSLLKTAYRGRAAAI